MGKCSCRRPSVGGTVRCGDPPRSLRCRILVAHSHLFDASTDNRVLVISANLVINDDGVLVEWVDRVSIDDRALVKRVDVVSVDDRVLVKRVDVSSIDDRVLVKRVGVASWASTK